MCPRWICGWLCGGGSTVDEQTIATPARVPSQIKAAGGGKEGGDSEAKGDKGGAFEAGGGKEGGNSEVGTEAAGGTPDSDAAVTNKRQVCGWLLAHCCRGGGRNSARLFARSGWVRHYAENDGTVIGHARAIAVEGDGTAISIARSELISIPDSDGTVLGLARAETGHTGYGRRHGRGWFLILTSDFGLLWQLISDAARSRGKRESRF
ncbi:hypothetical protein DFH08DRAFT_828385 [Mycena albidolilacea]|uniref:Uncharacterized protein n=1 Tax=Mycena albidolilacea TaxID=1033008 RepID=A0AAD7E6G2_9AGAR|nr:hypothetical protein DFH08DRAFT_828385 [Mycena albidolilacea]